VEQRAEEAADGAQNAEADQHAAVDVLAQADEAHCRTDQVGDGDDGHRQLGSVARGEERREHAADAETGDGGDGAGEDAGQCDDEIVEIHISPF
jgi:hypothetical protein